MGAPRVRRALVTAITLIVPALACAWTTVIRGALPGKDGTFPYFPAADRATSVLVDPSGDVIAGGYLGTGFSSMPFVAKFAGSTGKRIWAAGYPHTGLLLGGGCVNGFTTRVTLDPAGDVLLSSRLCNFPEERASVAKLASATGAVQWVAGGPGMSGGEWTSIASTSTGNVIVGGSVLINPLLSEYAVLARDGATGTTIWERRLTGADSPDADAAVETDGPSAAVDSGDDVIAGGSIERPAGYELVAIKLDGATGADLWPAPIVVETNSDEYIHEEVQVDANDDAVIAAERWSPPGVVVAKLAGTDGSEIWRTTLERSYGSLVLRIDSAGDVLVTAGGAGANVTKLHGASGTPLWTSTAACCPNYASDLGEDGPGGSVVVAETLYIGPSRQDIAVRRLDASTGLLLGHYQINGNGGIGANYGRALALGPNGTMLVGGSVLERVEDQSNFAVLSASERLAGARIVARDAARGAKLRVRIRDTRVIASAPGSSGDPTVSGATLELSNPVTMESTSIALPSSRWSSRPGRYAGEQVYKYTDPALETGPCKRASVTSGKAVDLDCRGLGGFSLDEPAQGALAVRLSIGGSGGAAYCARFDGLVDKPGSFSAKNAPPPDACR